MIHLDHNHSPAVLAGSPHAADQPAAVPWSSPSRDPRPFYPDSQEHAPPDASEQPAQPDKLQQSPSLAHPAAQPDAQQHNPPREPSPRSTADARSPPPDSNSSLTPPPDAATPNPAAEAQTEAQATTDGPAMEETSVTQGAEEVDKASRQSTPLSELSSAPETAPDDENATGDPQVKTESNPTESVGGEGAGGGSSSQQLSNAQQNTSTQSSSTGGTAPKQGSDGSLSRQHSQASSLSPTHSKAPSLDPKVVSILELNSLLLRVSMDFQARGVPMSDQTFHQYSLRLQSNLTWLAAAADENHKVSQSLMALPAMTPPPVVEFAEMDRIMHVYRELPNIFSKELARRQQASGSSSGFVNGTAKRERTEEPGPDSVHKRRDTGETKAQTPSGFSTPGAGPSTPHPPAQNMQQGSSVNLSAGPVQRMSSPSMPPPPVPTAAMGPNEAQMAAMRARQLQMRQAQQAQQQQQQAESSRQMSPPAGMGMQHGGGGGSGAAPVPALSQLTPAQLANLQNMGPMAVQHFQILQNPGHPFVQYLVNQVPGFMSLPTQDKLQKMAMAQNVIQARRQAQAQGGNAMGGFPQGGGMPIAPQHSGEGSPSRMSPVQQQSPMQQSFPYGGGNGSSDPRSMFTPQQQAAIAQMNPQQRQLFLMQQQQQMMMRGGGGGGGGSGGMNPQAMSQQAMMQERMRLEQQQRMQAAAAAGQSTPNMGGMGGGMDGSQFPALRSNPGMPGIARSARTPSDSGPSPVSQQRMAQSPEEQHQRALMMQQAQAQRAMSMSGGFPGGQQQQGGAQGWNQGMGQMQQQMGMGGQGQGGAYGMVSPPGSAGGNGGGGGGFPGMGGAPSPAASGNGGQMWGQGGGGGQFGGGPFMAPSPSASQHDSMTPGRGASATPGPHHSPSADQAGLNDLDFFNWGQ